MAEKEIVGLIHGLAATQFRAGAFISKVSE